MPIPDPRESAYLDVRNVDRLLLGPAAGRYSELGGGWSHAYGDRSVAAVVGLVTIGKPGIGVGIWDMCRAWVGPYAIDMCDMCAMLVIGESGDMGEMSGMEVCGERSGSAELGGEGERAPSELAAVAKNEGDFSFG